MANPLSVAINAKGAHALLKRASSITHRYGITAARMDHRLQQFVEILDRFNCGATFPITAMTLNRHPRIISKYLDRNIEFAVHGYTHIDSSKLSPVMHQANIERACEIFTRVGITPKGYRSPYLKWDDSLYSAIKAAGFSYVSNHSILWDGVVANTTNLLMNINYERALAFYNPWRISERPSLPRVDDQLIEIPVSLPDDEMLVDRLGGVDHLVKETWMNILSNSYRQEGLFTLQLHPERIEVCADALAAVLSAARNFTPKVWIARLDEIASWWNARARASAQVTKTGTGEYRCKLTNPADAMVLARSVEIDVPTSPWTDGYFRIEGLDFTVKSPCRPVIGISPSTPGHLAVLLHQQGYMVEICESSDDVSCYIDLATFEPSQEASILAQLDGSGCPMLRLGNWPHGARSALAVTGDIDALSIWDYSLRLLGK